MDYKVFKRKDEYLSNFDELKIKEALHIALDCRKFEIEMYWKRANYFAIIIGAIFIAYYTIKDELVVRWLLSFLGYSISYAWICLNRGSKFWQENWEKNIEYLSSAYGIPVFNLIRYGKRSQVRFLESYPYSVSRLNLIVSVFVFLAWLVVIIFNGVHIIEDDPCCLKICLLIGAGILLTALPIVIGNLGRGFMARDQILYLQDISTEDIIMK